MEPDRDLNRELFSAKAEAGPSEAVKLKVLPLNREPARDREPDRVLKIEDFSAKVEAKDREPDRDLARPLV